MTTIGKLFRTTAIKLSLVYLAVFAAFAVALVLYLNTFTTTLLSRQLNDTINAEIRGLAEQYSQRGLPGLVALVDRRSRQPGANLYLLVSDDGSVVVGNIARIPQSVFENIDSEPQELVYRLVEEGGDSRQHVAVVRVFDLRGDFKILVGRDVGERDALQAVVRQAFYVGGGLLILLGLFTWLFVSRRVLKRIDALSSTTQSIMSGDLSRRLQVTGSGDEFDRLAISVNSMLERIEELLRGLKEVSDNIAHDLKTPLTRLRNRVETALAEGRRSNKTEALETTLEEADQLIKTFDALLLIARLEARAQAEAMGNVDLAEIVRDMGELYEPVAEDEGFALSFKAPEKAPLQGNRELISQTVANLIENALKYGRSEAEETESKIEIEVDRQDDSILLSVADYGPGIAEGSRTIVTQRFSRLDESRTKPGSGLGLSLVTAVANLHDAKVDLRDTVSCAQNKSNHGLTVLLEFPALDPDTEDFRGSA